MRRMSSYRPQISWRTIIPGSEPSVASTSDGWARAAASDPPAGREMRTSSVPWAATARNGTEGTAPDDNERVPTVDAEPTAVAAGGDGIARAPDGRVVFIEGALPGERVRAEVTQERRDFLKARAVDIAVASPDRVAPPCPFVAAGCGGCQWQHVAVPAQHRLKAAIVADALRRIAHLPAAPVHPDVLAVPPDAYRTTLRLAVDREGRASFRRRHGHELVAVDACLVSHPALEDLVVAGRFRGATDVTLRVSAATGERLVLLRPASAAVDVPADV